MREVESTGEINIQRELLMKTNSFFFLNKSLGLHSDKFISCYILYTEDIENGILLKTMTPFLDS